MDDTAKNSSDYSHTDASLKFGKDQTMKKFVVRVTDDTHPERNEMVKINCTTNDTNINFMASCLTSNLGVELINDDSKSANYLFCSEVN